MKLIKYDKSIIPACDVTTLEKLKKIVEKTHDIEGVGAYKVGLSLALRYGLPQIVKIVRKITDLPIIYDHQKAGTDIPEMGEVFAEVCKEAGIDAVIIFPQAGPETERAWVTAARGRGLGVIVGGEMTHQKYKISEGGYIVDDALKDIYINAMKLGVKDFVIPGNRIDRIKFYVDLFKRHEIRPVFYSPGLITQGGEITGAGRAAGDNWHAIVGRALYNSEDMRKTATDLTSRLKSG